MITDINPLISKYENRSSAFPQNVDLFSELEKIKNGQYKQLIVRCRDVINRDDISGYKSLKSELPCVTFCGTFEKGHQAKNIVLYNKLLIVDVDDIDPDLIEQLKRKLENDVYTFSVFLSPSGRGLKILVKLDTGVDLHKLAFRAITKYYRENLQLEIDLSGSDVSRLCYVSWDPELYINTESRTFTYDYREFDKYGLAQKLSTNNKGKTASDFEGDNSLNLRTSYGLNKGFDRILMKRIITFLSKNKKSITKTHRNWYRCAYAIANTFSYDIGLTYFLRLSQLDGLDYDEYKSRELIKYCYLNRKDEGGVHFATILNLAKDQGFINRKHVSQ